MFEFYPVGNPILLAHIWILHIIFDRIAPKLGCFKKFCLRSKYPNRDVMISGTGKIADTYICLVNRSPVLRTLTFLPLGGLDTCDPHHFHGKILLENQAFSTKSHVPTFQCPRNLTNDSCFSLSLKISAGFEKVWNQIDFEKWPKSNRKSFLDSFLWH